MVDGDEPSVIEFNIRFGDPETQALVPRLKTDLFDLFYATASGGLSDLPAHRSSSTVSRSCRTGIRWLSKHRWDPNQKGLYVISCPERLEPDTSIFYAGVKRQ